MSGDGTPEIVVQVIEAFWSSAVLNNYVNLSVFALVFYEYFITLDSEVNSVWTAKLSGAKALFFINRYPFMLAQISSVVVPASYLNSTVNTRILISFNTQEVLHSCNIYVHLTNALQLLLPISTMSIFTLRIFAIYQGNVAVLAVLGTITVAVNAINLYIYYAGSNAIASSAPYNVGPLDCVGVSNGIDPKVLLALVIAYYSMTAFFDLVVFALTVRRTMSSLLQARRLNVKGKLRLLLFRDGAIYFFVLLSLNLAIILVETLPASSNSTVDILESILVTFYTGITWVMSNRLVLNLRQLSRTIVASQIAPAMGVFTLTSPEFAVNSVIGNLGAPLEAEIEENEALVVDHDAKDCGESLEMLTLDDTNNNNCS